MVKHATTHEEWAEALKGTASRWHRKYPFLDEDEIYSELLVAYAKALTIPLDEGVKFDTIMVWQKRATLTDMLREYHKPFEHGYTFVNSDDLLESEMASDLDVVHEVLVNVDRINLDEDALRILEYLMENGVGCDNEKRRRIGVATVIRDVVAHMEDMTYNRARKAMESLRMFCVEYATA